MIILLASTQEQGRYYARRDYAGEQVKVVTRRESLLSARPERMIIVGTFPRVSSSEEWDLYQTALALRVKGSTLEWGSQE